MTWSDKYKKSINCSSPKGFSQRAHCQARKLRSKGVETKSKPVNEDGAPANAAGGGAIAGIGVTAVGKPANWAEPGVSKKNQKKQTSILRRKAPNLINEEPKTGTFAGSQTFIVPSSTFHKAKYEKSKGKHWKTYIGEDEHGRAIREYDRKNKGKKPIILQDESTGAMCYAKYGKERNLSEAPLLQGIAKKHKFNYETGTKASARDIQSGYYGRKIASVDKEHDIHHSEDGSYYVIHKPTGKITTTISGVRNPKSKSFSINTVDSTGKGPKVHKVYRKILQSGHSTSLVGSSHSEGGQKIWQKLSSEKGVSVHGWHKGKPVNIDPKDPEETHVPEDEARRGYLRSKVDPAGKAIYKMKLVASLHKRKTV